MPGERGACHTVAVALEHRFRRLPDGSIWTQSGFGLPFWQRYRQVFENVRCIARVLDVTALEGRWYRADGEGVTFEAVPYYVGLPQFVLRAARVRRAVRAALRPWEEAFVLRVPGAIGTIVWKELSRLRHPYAVEVVADPYDVFSPGAIRLPLRRVVQWHSTRQLRDQCAGASLASYVTAAALQRRYPPGCVSVSISTVELADEAYAPSPHVFSGTRPVRLVFVGSLAHLGKGPDVVVKAVARCLHRGLDVRLTMVGDGRHRSELERTAERTRCRKAVQFLGQLAAGDEVRAELDRADVFVLASRQEGLPRSMLEAMARGLPCLGTAVGGIPELLSADAIVEPNDVGALATGIEQLVSDSPRMNALGARNLEVARAYHADTLQRRRVEFYRQVQQVTREGARSVCVEEAEMLDHRKGEAS